MKKFHNLSTGRQVSEIKPEYYSVKGHLVVGTEAEVEKFCKENKLTFEGWKPFFDYEFLVQHELDKIEEPKERKKYRKLEDVSEQEIKEAKCSTFRGNRSRVRICQVIDGDTMVIGILNDKQEFEKYKARLFGIDAAELGTEQGLKDKELVQKECSEYMWSIFLGREKYGRELIVLYHDSEYKHLYHPPGKCYLGGKK